MSFTRYRRERDPQEPLGILLLPCRLEDFELASHARDLLAIPRVVAVEPPARRTPRFLRDTLPMRQARRLRFPGDPRVLVLYHPMQYPLARALMARHDAELWYIEPSPGVLGEQVEELIELDRLARGRARQTVAPADDALRYRLRELEIISPRPFVPGARIHAR